MKDEGNRLDFGQLDVSLSTTSALHPWQCSLRTRGFRGRHRCGVTLLSGPTEESPADPFVLVGTAHCNYICKDGVTGDPLETCCCSPENSTSTCRDVGLKQSIYWFEIFFFSGKSVLYRNSNFYFGGAKWPLDCLRRVQFRRGDSEILQGTGAGLPNLQDNKSSKLPTKQGD